MERRLKREASDLIPDPAPASSRQRTDTNNNNINVGTAAIINNNSNNNNFNAAAILERLNRLEAEKTKWQKNIVVKRQRVLL